jgi:hypothetical protein
VTNSADGFGRCDARSIVRRGPYEPQATQDGLRNALILKLLVGIPTTIAVIIVMSFAAQPRSSSFDSTAIATSECRSKATVGSVFAIDWCRAGRVALEGSALGFATGARAGR